VSMAGNPVETFQTDGRLYLFSTLGPAASPEGDLTLVAMDEDWLSGIIFAVVILGGLILLRAKAPARLLVIGALIAALVLAGVFLPTFTLQLIDGVSLSALFIVLLGWVVMYLAWTRPRDPNVIARRDARQKVRMAQIYARLPQTAPLAAPDAPPPAEKASPPDKREKPGGDSGKPDSGKSDEGKGGRQDA
jgi:hypothetical protein